MLLPRLPRVPAAQIARKGLLAPRALRGVANGGQGAHALVQARVLQEERQGAVSAHGVARDGHAPGIELGKGREQHRGQFPREVALHVVVFPPGRLRGIEVEARCAAEIPVVVLAGVVGAARGGVWVEDREAQAGGVGVEEALFDAVVRAAGQAGEEDEDGGGGGGGGGAGDEEGEVHGGFGRGGVVREFVECAAKGGHGCVGGEGHDGWCWGG